MKVIEINKPKFIENTAENILLGFLDKTQSYDVVLARVRPGETLKLHKHKRPNSGDEIFLFHKGGVFDIVTDKLTHQIRTEDPVLVRFESGEPHSIVNRTKSNLEFFAFYVPPFEPGETETL